MPCEVQGCSYTTAKVEPEIAPQLLQFHQDDHELGLVPAKYFAPVRQVEDSEDAAAKKEQVKANKLARRRKQKAKIAKASNSIEEVEFKALKIDKQKYKPLNLSR